jgi:glycosyltransferase involved in cell wall biosynthesis
MSAAAPRRHHIVQVAGVYPPCLGGAEKVTQSLAELLARRHDVRVFTTRCGSNNAPHRESKRGVQVRRFAGFVVAHTPLSPGLALRLLVLGRRWIIHAHFSRAYVPEVVMLTSWLRRRPYVAHFHMDFTPSSRLGVFVNPYYKSWVVRPFLRRAAAVIALSNQQARFVEAHYGVSADRISVIPNGVDPSFYPLSTGSEESIGVPRAVRMLFVGRLHIQKNPARLIDAMKHVSSNVELVIVGDGELRDEIASRVDRLGLTNIRLVGPARGAELVQWYRLADAFVMSSDIEGMPLVLLEAMAGAGDNCYRCARRARRCGQRRPAYRTKSAIARRRHRAGGLRSRPVARSVGPQRRPW